LTILVISLCGMKTAWLLRFDRLDALGSILLLATVALALKAGMDLSGVPEPSVVSATIGKFIMAIILVQAALILFSGRPESPLIAALLILLFWPLSMVLSQRFYSS